MGTGVLVNLAVFLVYILMFYLIFIGIEKLFQETQRNKVDVIVTLSILTLFGTCYFFMPNKAKQNRKETLPHIESLYSIKRNDPRFEKVSFLDSHAGALAVAGTVRNQDDYNALKDIVSSYNFPVEVEWYAAIDRKDFLEDHIWNPKLKQYDKEILVYIGSIEIDKNEYIANFLNENGIRNQICNSVFLVDGSKICYIYVSPDKKEIALNLLKQIFSFKP